MSSGNFETCTNVSLIFYSIVLARFPVPSRSGREPLGEPIFEEEASKGETSTSVPSLARAMRTSVKPQNWVVDTWTKRNQKRSWTGKTPCTLEQEMALEPKWLRTLCLRPAPSLPLTLSATCELALDVSSREQPSEIRSLRLTLFPCSCRSRCPPATTLFLALPAFTCCPSPSLLCVRQLSFHRLCHRHVEWTARGCLFRVAVAHRHGSPRWFVTISGPLPPQLPQHLLTIFHILLLTQTIFTTITLSCRRTSKLHRRHGPNMSLSTSCHRTSCRQLYRTELHTQRQS